MKNKHAAWALLSMALLASMGPHRALDLPTLHTPRPKRPKYPFSPEELDTLAELEGKEKKDYLKELRAKYKVTK